MPDTESADQRRGRRSSDLLRWGAELCDAVDVNLDDWWSLEASQRFETVTTILSLFTIRVGRRRQGRQLHHRGGTIPDDTNFRLWFSAEPGGAPLSVTSRCDNYFKQARFTVPWTQNPSTRARTILFLG